MSEEPDAEQARFRDGRVVREPTDCDISLGGADPVRPNEETGFRVAVKPGAVEVNEPLADVEAEHGTVVSFGSRAAAEAFAARLSAADGDLRVQAAAPNDPGDADAYLLADHQPAVAEPARVDGDTLTFDVGANLYGALGEAVVLGGPTSPALEHFVERDLADARFEDELRVRVTDGEYVPVGDGSGGWLPDCRVEARDGPGGRLVERYRCEIKTGNASFERSQVAAMRELAAEARVLKLRVLVDELPDRYSVRVHEVEPDG